MSSPSARRVRGLVAGAAVVSALSVPAVASAEATNQPGWTTSSQELSANINLGYELAIDPIQHRIYGTDALPTTATRTFARNADGSFKAPAEYTDVVSTPSTGKVTAFSTLNNSFVRNYSFTGLLSTNANLSPNSLIRPAVPAQAGPPAVPAVPAYFDPSYIFDVPGGADDKTPPRTGVITRSNLGTGNLPYGVGVDARTTTTTGSTTVADPTIVTVQTRTSTVAVWKSSQAPTNADVIRDLPAADGSAVTPGSNPVLTRARTPVVDSTRHRAYISSYDGSPTGGGAIGVLDTLTKKFVAYIPVPGVVALSLDEATGRLYAGTLTTAAAGSTTAAPDAIKVIDTTKIDTSAAPTSRTDFGTNGSSSVIVASSTDQTLGKDLRPAYDAAGKKLYVGSQDNNLLHVLNADPTSADYLKKITSIEIAGSPNSLTVDPTRRLVYVAGLGGRVVSVIDASTDTFVQAVPTVGSAIDVDVEPLTGVAYVSNQGTGSQLSSAGPIQAITVKRDVAGGQGPKGDKGDTGAAGANGTNGSTGSQGVAGQTGAQGPAGANGAQGAAGPAGAQGPAGPAGADAGAGGSTVSLSSLRVIGTSVRVQAPGAGTYRAVVKSGRTTVATGSVTAKRAGSVTLRLKKTNAGKKLLRSKAVKGTLTVTYTPAKARAVAAQRSVSLKLARTKR